MLGVDGPYGPARCIRRGRKAYEEHSGVRLLFSCPSRAYSASLPGKGGQMDKRKQYLGDGVYIKFDGFNFVLTTETSDEVTQTIVLEPGVLHEFMAYVTVVLTDEGEVS